VIASSNSTAAAVISLCRSRSEPKEIVAVEGYKASIANGKLKCAEK